MLVKPPRSGVANRPAVLTCQHVACPWLFPNYFADKWDWLQHVSEEFVRHSLQLLEPSDGRVAPRVLLELPLARRVWIHGSRDVAMLALNDELVMHSPEAEKMLHVLELLGSDCQQGDELLFSGHQQFPDQLPDEKDADILRAIQEIGQFPKQVAGQFVGKSSRGQAFARSDEVLEEGMCGGAVLDPQGNCVGLIEGVVPPVSPAPVIPSSASASEAEAMRATWKMQKALENHVAFIPGTELVEFVNDEGEMLLTGTALGDDDDDDELW